jgi:Co/Zn/Cd efflux system component
LAEAEPSDAPPQCGGGQWACLRYRKALWLVAFSALALALSEMAYGRLVSSADLLESGVDWIYDVGIYGIAALSIGRAKSFEQRAAFALAAILGVAGFHGAYALWGEYAGHAHDIAGHLEASSAIAILGSLAEAAFLFRFRGCDDPVMKATWFTARNSVVFSGVGGLAPLAFSGVSTLWPQLAIDGFGVFLAFQASFAIAREALGAR